MGHPIKQKLKLPVLKSLHTHFEIKIILQCNSFINTSLQLSYFFPGTFMCFKFIYILHICPLCFFFNTYVKLFYNFLKCDFLIYKSFKIELINKQKIKGICGPIIVLLENLHKLLINSHTCLKKKHSKEMFVKYVFIISCKTFNYCNFLLTTKGSKQEMCRCYKTNYCISVNTV